MSVQHRHKFETRTILLRAEQQRQTLLSLVPNLPVDCDKPLQIVIREEVKPRKLSQNDLMWSGPLADIEQQAYIDGRRYNINVWHHHLKILYLPEEFDEEITKIGYRKWDYLPTEERVLVGSTTQLTIKGFSIYLEQILAFGANLGVRYSVNPKERFTSMEVAA